MLRLVPSLLVAVQVVGPFSSTEPAWSREASNENVVRRAHAGPFEGRTMVWLRVMPRAGDKRVTPTTFVFSTEFKGKEPRGRPPVTLSVATDVRFYPLMPRTPTLHWTIDADPPTELLAPGEATSIGYCCDDGPIPVSAVAPLSAERLDRLATAFTVTGVALGVPFTLDAAQLRALAEFRRALLPESY